MSETPSTSPEDRWQYTLQHGNTRFVVGEKAILLPSEYIDYSSECYAVPVNICIGEARFRFHAIVELGRLSRDGEDVSFEAQPGMPGHCVDAINDVLGTKIPFQTGTSETIEKRIKAEVRTVVTNHCRNRSKKQRDCYSWVRD